MDAVTGAVALAGLKFVGEPAAKVITDFVQRMLAPVGDQVGGLVADPIQEYRERRALRAQELLLAAAEEVERRREAVKVVPPNILIPILDRGSLEENDALRRQWVNLLATAGTRPEKVPPAFTTILSELSPVDAAVLSLCYGEWKATQHPRPWSLVGNSTDVNEYLKMAGVAEHEGQLVEDNLIRLRLFADAPPALSSSEIENVLDEQQRTVPWKRVSSTLRTELVDAPVVTRLGFAFMEAVMDVTE